MPTALETSPWSSGALDSGSEFEFESWACVITQSELLFQTPHKKGGGVLHSAPKIYPSLFAQYESSESMTAM